MICLIYNVTEPAGTVNVLLFFFTRRVLPRHSVITKRFTPDPATDTQFSFISEDVSGKRRQPDTESVVGLTNEKNDMFQRVDSPDSYPSQQSEDDRHSSSVPGFPVPAYATWSRYSTASQEHPTREMLSALDPHYVAPSYGVATHYTEEQDQAQYHYRSEEQSAPEFSERRGSGSDYYDVVDDYTGPSRPPSSIHTKYSSSSPPPPLPPPSSIRQLNLIQNHTPSPTTGRFSFSQDRNNVTIAGSGHGGSPRTEYPASALSPMRYPQSPLTKDFVRMVPHTRSSDGSAGSSSTGSGSRAF